MGTAALAGLAGFKEAPAVRGGRCGPSCGRRCCPRRFKEAPAVRGGRFRHRAQCAAADDRASKRPLLFAGEDTSAPRRWTAMCALQRGPCCSRGKIGQAGRVRGRVGEASKRPPLFAGEDPTRRDRAKRSGASLQRGPCCSRGKITSSLPSPAVPTVLQRGPCCSRGKITLSCGSSFMP